MGCQSHFLSSLAIMDVDGGHSSAIFVLLVLGIVVYVLRSSEKDIPELKSIPAVGTANYLLSYIDALRFTTRCQVQLRRGYEKARQFLIIPNKGEVELTQNFNVQSRIALFKMATLNRWLVIITGTRSIERLRKSEEHEASLSSVAIERDAFLYHIGHLSAVAHPRVGAFTSTLTQNLTFLIPSIREEVMLALNSAVPPAENSTGWQELEAMNLVVRVTTRVINRVVLGLPLTRDEEYLQLSSLRAQDVYSCNLPLLFTVLPKTVAATIKALRKPARQRRRLHKLADLFIRECKAPSTPSVIEDRVQQRQNDLLSYILAETTPAAQLPVEDLASHLLDLSLTASQTVSMTFAHALYHLAANPKFAAPMRKETEQIVAREGWSKPSLEHMRKIDSFVKESTRMSGVSSVSMMRKTLQPLTLEDETLVPENILIAAASHPRHYDATIYTSPETFDGFRFSKLHELHFGDSSSTTQSSSSSPYGLVTTGADYLAWGYGRHACPGRFLAATVVKTLLAYVVLHYDVRFEDGLRPEDVVMGTNCLPNPRARMMIRRR